ncbi:unnamed protein product [Fraxinus pennsylvanica]|uniref:Uncharacterized protein n=1 Tax=Fraxinus pennsylvanica TaxID=56036 RepID=A0AAD1Z4V2_9LAMI|nr:unnamed protein product [Fraxinus pennsylvanica]
METAIIYCSMHVAITEKNYPPDFLNKVTAEIIATYLLVFVTCGSAALSASDEHKVSKLGASVAGGLIVTVMIYAVGHISGAHMNPAVTLAFAAVSHFPWKQDSEKLGFLENELIRVNVSFMGKCHMVVEENLGSFGFGKVPSSEERIIRMCVVHCLTG